MNFHKIYILQISLSLLVLLSSCNKPPITPYEKESFHMDTTINQRIYGQNAVNTANEVDTALTNVENKMTMEGNESDVAKINKAAGNGTYVSVSPETSFVIEKARYFNKFGDGNFDITLGPVITLWGITKPNPHVPPKEKIESLLHLRGIDELEVNPVDKNQYRLKRVGQSIDLGGIAKGYSGDVAIEVYKRNNINSAFINLGGNVVVLGKKTDGTSWKVGIQNPRTQNGRYIGIVNASDSAVVTSGDYERFFEENNKRYHHILDPKTGYPADTGLISTTIVAESSIEADALSTTTFVSGLDKSFEILKKYGKAGGIFITSKKEVYITKNLEGKFELNDETGEYKLVESR